MTRYRTFDEYIGERLKDPKKAALYLTAAAEENDPVLMLDALAQVARAHGVSRLAKKISISRMGLYKSVSKNGNPSFRTLLGILRASGLRMTFEPAR